MHRRIGRTRPLTAMPPTRTETSSNGSRRGRQLEHPACGEVLGNLYGVTGKREYLELAQRFDKRGFVDPLAAHRDELKGLHVNTHVPQVIAAANSLLAGTATGSVQLRAQQPSGEEVRWFEATDEVAEAAAVGDRIAELRAAGVPLREMAVLFRINAQSETFEEALASRSIPYVVRGAARFFERPEVRQALALLRASLRAGEAARDGEEGGGEGGEGVRKLAHAESGHTYLREDGQ